MKKLIWTTLAACLLGSTLIMAQEEIKLYPNGPKESNELTRPESNANRDDGWISDISEARMYAYIVPKEKASGAAVVICPGGGYAGIAATKEGSEYAQWLNEQGVSAFVLYYRMPNGHHRIPLTDAQTAIEIVRKNARKWNIDPHKIGISGFSAGGHLASTAGTHFTKKNRPDFMILLYPVITMKVATHGGSKNNLLGDNQTKEMLDLYSNELQVNANTPPAFIVHAKDDNVVPIVNSEMFYKSLQANGVSAELHVYEHGGHGFGLRKTGADSEAWPEQLKLWLKANDLTK